MTEHSKLLEQITEMLAKSQFRYWVDGEPKTAEEVNSQDDRAIQLFLGSFELPHEKAIEAGRFRSIVQMQAALIMSILKPMTDAHDALVAACEELIHINELLVGHLSNPCDGCDNYPCEATCSALKSYIECCKKI